MRYWNSPDGIQGTAREFTAVETIKCQCGCDTYFPADLVTCHHETSENIAYECLDSYNAMIEKERIENL